MIGTLINGAGIILGSLVGLLAKKIIPERLGEPIIKAEGVGIFVIGLFGAAGIMITVVDGSLKSSGELLLLISLVTGVVAGELLRIEDRINSAANRVEKLINREGFSKGFVSAALIFCVGAMTIMGPLNEQLRGDMSLLLIKSLLDTVTAMMLTVTLGFGVMFAAIPVILLQGGVALLASLLAGVPNEVIGDLCMVGYAIVMCIGINFIFGDRIKTANLLPALLVPIVYHLLF